MFGSGLDIEHAFVDHEAMTRTRVRRRRFGALVVVTAAFVAVVAHGAQALGPAEAISGSRARPGRYVVQSGDSLWSIALNLDQGRDPRIVVEIIAKMNHLDDERIAPGQLLMIPAHA
jgi:nucleoid-associated protein YgaU